MNVLTRLFWGLHVAGIIPVLIFLIRRRGPPEPIRTRGFVVDTTACRIPDIDPLDRSVARYIRRTGYRIMCRKVASMTYEDGDIIHINWAAVNTSHEGKFKFCRFQPISRESDFQITYGNFSVPFNQSIKIKDEFVRIYCFSNSGAIIYKNFHALIIPRRSTERKCYKNLQQHVLKNNPEEVMNVLMVGLDSVSRLNFMRQMPLTRNYLLNYLHGIELLGYTKVADNTFPNVIPLTTGKFADELPWNEEMKRKPFDNYTFLWNKFSQNGYRTLYAEDAPYTSAFTYLKAGFRQPPADHYIRAFGIALEGDNSVWNNDHMCVGDRAETDITLKYVRDFAAQYRKKPYFGFTFLTRLTHDNANTAGLADSPHFSFLKRIYSEGLLNNTVLVYFSDHGMRFGEMRRTFVGKLEERMPLLMFVLPKWFKDKYPQFTENMKRNSRRLTTSFDVYETLINILHFKKDIKIPNVNRRGVSLFSEVPRDRTCDKAAILPHWCMCFESNVLSTSSKAVMTSADVIIQHINEELYPNRNLCHILNVKKIHRAVQLVPSDAVLRFSKSMNDVINRTVEFGARTKALMIIQLTLETDPGEAVFEGTVSVDETNQVYSTAGDISRINKYGDQSMCVDSFKLRKYCICK